MNEYAANIQWQTNWIWNDGEASPRNEWWCFRTTLELSDNGWNEANFSLTADSRYVLYVNGQHVGRGPVRSWPFEQAYDTYNIVHLLKPGRNTIAVMVMHFGVSTFYYIKGRGGLLAQLELADQGKIIETYGTDTHWKVSRHWGQDSRSPRMSCQQGFAERIDARLWDLEWIQGDYDDSTWSHATIIGPVSMAPWTELKPRDIPFLTEELVWPVRVEALAKVKPIAWSTTIDVRNHMVPDSIEHANLVGYVGYVVTNIRVTESVKAILGFPNASANFRACSLNGTWYLPEQFTGEQPERYLDVQLTEGDNLLIIDVSGMDHGRGLHIGLDCDLPFTLVSPIDDSTVGSAFVAIGPFKSFMVLDHQPGDNDLFSPATEDHEVSNEIDRTKFPTEEVYRAYLEVKSFASCSDLSRVASWVHPISSALVSRDSIFSLCVWKKESVSASIPMSLQQVVIADSLPGIIPLYDQAETEFIIDFGKELTGYITFECEANDGTMLDFYGFEYMRDGWRQDTFDLDNTIRYTCREGRQVYTSPVRRGLRYLMVTVREAKRPVKLFGVQMMQSNYPVAEIGRFQCSDSLLNDIWGISRHTTRLCMEDTFVDCPAYEQVFWVGDSRNEALVNYYVFGATPIVKRCLRLVPGSKGQTPLYVDQVPSGWSSVIPNWTFFWAMACSEYYEHTADTAFAVEMWPHVQTTLDCYLEKLDERGLLFIRGWNLLDWAPIDQPNDGVVTHQNLFLVKTLRAAANLAKAAGFAQEGMLYQAASERLSSAINQHLWSEERLAYLDCIHSDGRRSKIFSMQTQVVAYLCEVADGDRAKQIEQYLLKSPLDFVQIGSPFMSFFYYEALAKMGCYNLMLDDIRLNFGQMIQYDATTCWEMYPNFMENRANPNMLSRSHCHAWSAAPGYFLGAHVLGVRSGDLGWRKVIVEPQIADLTWARGTVPLPEEGRVDVSWRVTEVNEVRTLKLEIWAPKDLEVIVVIPEGLHRVVKKYEI